MGYIYSIGLYSTMKNEKTIIKNTEIETNPAGIKIIRVTLQKGSEKYIRGISYTDMMDPKAKKSIYNAWRKSIDKIEREKAIKSEDAEANIKNLVGMELPEDE